MAMLPPLDVLDLTHLRAGATVESRRAAWDELHAAAALQGLVNRGRERLYLLFVNEGKTDRFWLQEGWPGRKTRPVPDLMAAVRRYRKDVRGLVAWDERVPATANVATTAAGVENLLPVRYDPAPNSLYSRLRAQGLPVRRWLLKPDGAQLFTSKADAYGWAVREYLRPGRCKGGLLGYYPDAFWLSTPRDISLERTLLSNHDYLVQQKGFVFDLSPWLYTPPDDEPGQPLGEDGRTFRLMLGASRKLARGGFTQVAGFTPWDQKYTRFTAGPKGEVETEWYTAQLLSEYAHYLDADAAGLHAMANASAYTHFPLRRTYPQPKPDVTPYVDADGMPRADKRYVSIYAGDYDSAAWFYQVIPDRWNDPRRGEIPIGWAFNPALARRFGLGLHWARLRAKPNDHFIAGDSGYGYVNPGALPPGSLPAWERLNREGYRQWGLTVTGFVIDGFAPEMSPAARRAYARFSPRGVVAQRTPLLSLVDGVPFVRMGTDIPTESLEAGYQQFERTFPGPGFGTFRTILWTPAQLADFVQYVKARRPDVEIVAPEVMFELARRWIEKNGPTP